MVIKTVYIEVLIVNKLATAMLLVLSLGCSSDISVHEQRETRVVVDSYVQPDQLEELDVLVVLDTSGSMSDNYNDVADGMDILRMDIESLTLDYQFGYITMDPTNPSYVGPYDASSSAIDMLMAPNLLPMTMPEEGFASTYSFFSSIEPYDFRRPEADFLLFLISDEDEQSSITADLFYEWMHSEFQGVKHDVVCIVNPDDGTGNSWANEIGYKYIELANLYGKDIMDLQSDDWSAWLSDSSYLTHKKDYMYLSDPEPILETIVVYVDQSAIYDWDYIPESNMIQLGFLPDHGSLVEVGYQVYKE